MAATLLALALLYAAFAALAHLAADRLIFPAPRPSYDARTLPVTTIAAEDGAGVAVLHLPDPAARYTVLYSHGNGEDLGTALPGLEALRAFAARLGGVPPAAARRVRLPSLSFTRHPTDDR